MPTPRCPPQHSTVGRSLGQGPPGLTARGRAADPAAPLPACVWGRPGPALWGLLGGSVWPETEPGGSVFCPCPSASRPDGECRLPGPRGGGQSWASDRRTASRQFPGGPAAPHGASVLGAVCAGSAEPCSGLPVNTTSRPGPAPPGTWPPGGGRLVTQRLILKELGSGRQWTASPSRALATHGQTVFDSS